MELTENKILLTTLECILCSWEGFVDDLILEILGADFNARCPRCKRVLGQIRLPVEINFKEAFCRVKVKEVIMIPL